MGRWGVLREIRSVVGVWIFSGTSHPESRSDKHKNIEILVFNS